VSPAAVVPSTGSPARADADRVTVPAPRTRSAPDPKPAPDPEPTRQADPAVHYKNCAAVVAAGKAPIHRGDPGYSSALDRDGDGVGCAGD
jgi:hypothetical protein